MTKPARRPKLEILRARRILDLTACNVPPTVVDLPSGQTIAITRAGERRDGQRVEKDSAKRLDVFDLIDLDRPLREAARRLEGDMYARRGEADGGRPMGRVDASQGYSLQDYMLMAGDRVTNALKRIGGRDAFLLTELIYPSIPGEQWRVTVLRVTKEINPVSQATVIRSACANLAEAYAEIDR